MGSDWMTRCIELADSLDAEAATVTTCPCHGRVSDHRSFLRRYAARMRAKVEMFRG